MKMVQEETENTPERNLWSAVLYTYFNDSKEWTESVSKNLKKLPSEDRKKILEDYDLKIDLLMRTAESEWTEIICGFIGLDFNFFLDNLHEYVKRQKAFYKIN